MNPALAFKAEVVLGFQLVSRHRAPRLAAVMGASLVALLLTGDATGPTLQDGRRALLLIAGTLASVAASRLLARGGPLAAFRQTAAPWPLAPAGRLAGGMLLVAPLVLASGIALVGRQGGAFQAFRSTAVAILSAAAVAAAVMALTPFLGASASAALGLVAALAGGALPSQVGPLLQARPLARAPLVMCWNVLPLSWRAARWLAEGGVGDLAWLTAWLLFGLAAAEWAATRRVGGAAAGASG